MQKRNLTLFIILIVIIFLVVSSYLYFNKSKDTTETVDTGTGINFVSSLFNFGNKNNTNNNNGGGNGEEPADISGYVPPSETENPKTRLNKVSSMPVAGFTVFNMERYTDIPYIAPKIENGGSVEETKKVVPSAPPTEFITSLRYVASLDGNIYQTFADKINERKLTETIIPSVQEAYFGDNGNTVIMRYLKNNGRTIETFTGSLPQTILGADFASLGEVVGSFLPENITDISISPDTSKIFYLLGLRDGVIGTTAGALGTNKVQIFDSKFTEWLSQWVNKDMISITTKPSAYVSGYMYIIDPNSKTYKKILGEINGLTTLTSPDGNLVLYNNNNLTLNVYNIETGEYKQLGVKTLPEKCVWNNSSDMLYCAVPKFTSSSNYPDVWYQGEISFSDDLWKISMITGGATLILDPLAIENGSNDSSSQIKEDIDGIKLKLDSSEKYLFFINKKDSHLWEFELK